MSRIDEFIQTPQGQNIISYREWANLLKRFAEKEHAEKMQALKVVTEEMFNNKIFYKEFLQKTAACVSESVKKDAKAQLEQTIYKRKQGELCDERRKQAEKDNIFTGQTQFAMPEEAEEGDKMTYKVKFSKAPQHDGTTYRCTIPKHIRTVPKPQLLVTYTIPELQLGYDVGAVTCYDFVICGSHGGQEKKKRVQ